MHIRITEDLLEKKHFNARGLILLNCVPPVIKDAMDHQPLQLNSKATEFFFHADKEGIFVLSLRALVIVTLASKVYRGRFVHVSFPLVVTEHHLAVQLQLRKSG